MSFSSDIKQELNKNSNLSNKELVKNELIGYLISGNTSIEKNKIKFSTESDYNINRFSKLLSNLDINHEIDVSGKIFFITVNKKYIDFVKINNDKIYLSQISNNQEENKAIIRGLFMGAGSINNPENKYHLEIIIENPNHLEIICKILKQYDLNIKILKTSKRCSIYIKEGEDISNFLALIGANRAVLRFEDIRVKREMSGKVNRLVNCETANLTKTINASVEQIEAIRKLQKSGKFNSLDNKLKEIAILRIENPDMPLADLGKLLKNPVGKSGANYRLQKIIEISKGL